MLVERTIIEKKILNYMQQVNMQYRRDKAKKTHALDSFVFNYSNMFNAIDMIKIEINYMNRIHLFDYEKRSITLPLMNSIEVLTLNKFDLFASKMSALVYRTTIRDIYDVNNMIKNKTINRDELVLFRKCSIFYLLLSSENKIDIKLLFDECKTRMISFIGNRVPQYLTSTLKLNEEFDIKSAVDNINLSLDEFLDTISDNEIAFIKYFPNPFLRLFGDPIIDEKIKEHPMIKWKMTLMKD